ncbi:MAG: prkC 20, partial [Planctomycetaceae bacterium]|nr:prkC 20 [Planctomycetaceae bacterium]
MNSLCSIELLESALSGNLTAENEVALHRHLEECESCATTMEQLAGGPGWCQEAAALLGADELDSNAAINRDDWSVVDFTVEHLEPAEEPNTLGRLGGYDVLEIIGRGGMGVVLKGFDRELKRCVAIKVLAPHLAHSPLARKRFAREAQAAAAVVHPHVLAIHQVQPGGRLPFLVMPLVAGESLAQRLTARGTLELKEILRIGMQAAAGLAAAHEQGLVHRDVKPANILLEKGVERAVLTDFGLARAADDVAMTRWGIIAGTPQYMSPEQAQGQTLDGRSDLFSLGCVLYEMATGTSPFRADSTIATLRRLVDDQPASMITLNSELPQWFVNIVDRLLEKSPAQRFESAAEVSDLLERCLAHVQQPTTVSLPDEICFATQKPSVPAPTKTRLPLKSAGIAWGAIIALLLFLGCVWWVPAMLGSAGKAERAASETNLHRLTAALIAYVEEHGHFPASAIYGKDGKGGPPHSWRVEILPYLGHRALYEQYRFDELWDSEQNSTLMAKMPDVLRSPVDSRDSVNTAYFGVISGDAKAVVDAAPLTTATSAQTLGRTPGGLENSSPPGNSAPPLSDASVSTDRGEVVKLNAVDEFVARRLAARQWGMLYLNNKSEWLRRTTLDLVGTLPSEADVRAFLSDDSSTAMDRAVERLLTGTKQLTRGTIAEGVFVPDGSTIFSRPLGAKYSEIPDGTMHTIAIVEAKRSIPWTKPEDLTYDSTQNASPLGGWYKEGWYAGFADGNVKFVPLDTLPARLRAYFTIQGGEIDSATSSLQLDKTELQPRDAIENPLPSEKVINGRIIAINEQEGTVTVNAGSQQGVKNREFFLVLRDIRALEPVTSKVLKGTQLTSTVQLVEVRRNQIVGRLRVVRVDEHESIAQIEETDRAGLRVDDKVQLARLTISAPAPNSARQTQQGAESPANTGSVPATPSPPPANVSSVLGVDGFNG